MPLSIEYVRSLEDVINPTLQFLSRPIDLFARQRIVVPTAGAKAWLMAELAKRLGVSGELTGDGIVANVEFLYPGAISKLLLDGTRPDIDLWQVDYLAFTILKVLADDRADNAKVQ
jgi:exonuclease V gamma subunit